MLNHNFFGIAATVANVIAFIPYIRAIFKKETKPSGASWWTWTFLNSVALASSWYAGAPSAVLILPAWLCLSELFVAILSIKRGDNNWDKWNKLCVAGACIGIGLWAITGEPLLALMITIIADLLASIPTFRHAWTNPGEEDRLAWTLGFVSVLLEIFAINHWSLAESAWPIYFLLNMTIMLLLVWRPVYNGRQPKNL